jgi:hypothetical protein
MLVKVLTAPRSACGATHNILHYVAAEDGGSHSRDQEKYVVGVPTISRGNKELECGEPKRLTGAGLIMYGTGKRDKVLAKIGTALKMRSRLAVRRARGREKKQTHLAPPDRIYVESPRLQCSNTEGMYRNKKEASGKGTARRRG